MEETHGPPTTERLLQDAEESADRALESYGEVMAAAGRVSEDVERSGALVRSRALALQRQILANADETMTACLDFSARLVAARTPVEAAFLPAAFVRERLLVAGRQTVDLAAAGVESFFFFSAHARRRL